MFIFTIVKDLAVPGKPPQSALLETFHKEEPTVPSILVFLCGSLVKVSDKHS